MSMKIIVNVPAECLEFALEVLRNRAFVESARPQRPWRRDVFSN